MLAWLLALTPERASGSRPAASRGRSSPARALNPSGEPDS
jgi:hypothetical protein